MINRNRINSLVFATLLGLSTVFYGCSQGETGDGITTSVTNANATATPTSAPTATPTSAPTVTPDPHTDGLHKDADNNGYCDICSICVEEVINIYAVNDLHGKFKDTDVQPGVDEMTTYLRAEALVSDNFILFSSGDMWQGSSESNLTYGALITEWMNSLGFVSMTFGNHEYDWGKEQIESNLALADFPFLAINIYEKSTNALASYCAPSVIVENEGVTVGIIGAIGDCYSSISGDKVTDVYFITGKELTDLVMQESERLRQEGCDVILYSIHDGYSKSGSGSISTSNLSGYYDIALSNGYVDVVFEGHTHSSYTYKDSYGVWHLQDGGDNKTGLSHVVMTYNTANNNKRVDTAEILKHEAYTSLSDDAIVEELLAKYDSVIGDVTSVLGYCNERMDRNALRQLAADLYFDYGLSVWGEKYDIVLAGGFFSVRSPGALPAGEVTYEDLQTLFPFDNELVLCKVKGIDLNNNFFATTNSNYFITYGDYGAKVKNNLSLNDYYYIVTDTYTSTYAPNKLTEVERLGKAVYARDLLAEYFKKNR